MEETERIEEYLETLVRLEETGTKPTTTLIAKLLSISAPSVSEMLQKLADKQYISYSLHKGIELTFTGREIGKNMLNRHRLLEEFLRAIEVPEVEIHNDACKLEHVITPAIAKGIQNFLKKRKKRGNFQNLNRA